MIETLAAIPEVQPNSPSLFYYQNTTSQVQCIRLEQVCPQFEKVVFPGEQFLFHATAAAFLEIYVSTMPSLTLVSRVPCSQLRVIETEDSE